MSRYIDADKLKRDGWHLVRERSNKRNSYIEGMDLDCVPTADVVSRGVLEQVMWERNLAVSQLAEIGKGLGEKMDDVVKVQSGHWINVNGDGSAFRCSVCGEISCCNAAYCNDCGASMTEGVMEE